MRKILIVLLFIFASSVAKAQFIKNKAINAQIGFGMAMPYNSVADVASDGILLQGEYVLAVTSWFELRPYAGFIFTKSNGKDPALPDLHPLLIQFTLRLHKKQCGNVS